MGPHPEDGEVPGQLSVQGCKEAHREAAAADDGWDMGLPASGGGTGGSGDRGDTEVGNEEAEHGRAIYCDATDYGPIQAGHSAAESEGVSAVAGAGRNITGGAKKQAEEKTTRLKTYLEEESDMDSNRDSGGEDESPGASGSSGAEWSGAEDG